jgi:anaerobic selenocysteine-containing dehydrogenase
MESGEAGIFSPVDHIEPAEPTDSEFPFVLSTGRRRSTYHTGTQTGKAKGFDKLINEEYVEINPKDAQELKIDELDVIKVESRRGSVEAKAKISDKSPVGAVFMSFAFPETTRTNDLTSDAVDFITETPEYKACAVKLSLIR